jgi:5-methylcytosine-specific restriction endonuclease McrA
MRDGHRCTMCGKAYDLEIHHKTYNVNGRSIVGREMDFLYCLTTLCEDCHAKVHNK